MTSEHKLWQNVLLQAMIDATFTGDTEENYKAKKAPIKWITKGGRDFCAVCDLAGMDADFVRESYLAGRVNGELLRSAQGRHKEVSA